MSIQPPLKCQVCGINRVAWTKPRVDVCYTCLPGGPFTPPPCRSCGSTDYFSQGQCTRCHPGAPLHIGACRGCLAWGVYRQRSWLCWSCRWWRSHYEIAACQFCDRESRINGQGACRLCWENARFHQEVGRAPNLADAVRLGQQLFLANLQYDQTGAARRRAARERELREQRPDRPATTVTEARQLLLFRMPAGHGALKQRALTQHSPLLQHCEPILREHAERHSWSTRQTNSVVHTLKLLDAQEQWHGQMILASDIAASMRHGGTMVSTIEILDAAGLLTDDRVSAVELYFAKHTAGLPEPMLEQLQLWFDIMLNGSATAPRRRARTKGTIKWHIQGMAPIWRRWAKEGHQSLAEITRQQFIDAVPAQGSSRVHADQGLRSVFDILKSRKRIFANPTRGVPVTQSNATVPLTLDTAKIREALNSPDTTAALSVALVAFHGLTAPQISSIQLTDVVDGKLSVAGKSIPLAGPVLSRLAAYLDYRARTWPNTLNPHLIVTRKTAPRAIATSRLFAFRKVDVKPQALRDDRILQEILATGGDARRICDFFGLGIEAANRYTSALGHPGLNGASDTGAEEKTGTHDPT
ncbi:hypothetical protein [Kitasatospora phosalacinea]|uniref:Tyr recombinase domain-containing protein n=1 Tax=Kitasatospora phosalacinea TaxID=2065 RepID=A0A9W6PRK4_9ACTN|nr:hypothetical protein [Kitasatospora phosalacinea]GLW59626.1 hypothetical protein Kpho01_76360 [Kitasatospora phosalacinea]